MKSVRLMMTQSQLKNNEIVVLNVDTKEQCAVSDHCQVYCFFCDCIGLTQPVLEKAGAGQVVATFMSAENWKSWVDYHGKKENFFVWLGVTRNEEGGVNALNLGDGTAIELPASETAYIAPDCWPDFPRLRFNAGQKSVVRMTVEDWEIWIEAFDAEYNDNSKAEQWQADRDNALQLLGVSS